MAIPRWEQIDVTSSRRPILRTTEEVQHVQSHVGLYSGKHKVPDLQDGVIYLTSHRVCYVDSTQPALKSYALELQHIARLDHIVGSLNCIPIVS